tara:strand:+ start:458 stop:1816 length:1359 start_codon:yes stop_codon:yes gene_type:complete
MEVNSALNQIKLNTKNFCLDGDFVLNAIKSEDYFENDLCPEDKQYLEDNFDNFLEITKSKKSSHYLYNLENLNAHFNQYSSGTRIKDLKPLHRLGKRFNNRIRNAAGMKSFSKNQKNILSLYSLFDKEGWSALFFNDSSNAETKPLKKVSDYVKLHSFSYNEVMKKQNNILSSLMNEKRKSQQNIKDAKDFFFPFNQASKFYVVYDPFLFSSFSYNRNTKNHMLGHDQRMQNSKFIFDDNHFPSSINDFDKKFLITNNNQHYIYSIFEKILRYAEWIKLTHNDTKNYPTIYFCSKTKFDKQEWSSVESILLSMRFLKNVSKLNFKKKVKIGKFNYYINKGTFEFVKKMIDMDKLKLIPISDRKLENGKALYIEHDPILHDNCLLTNYGYFNWGNRDNGFKKALIKKKSINTRFSTIFQSKEFDLNDIFQFFNKEINLVSKKIKKVGNLFEIN